MLSLRQLKCFIVQRQIFGGFYVPPDNNNNEDNNRLWHLWFWARCVVSFCVAHAIVRRKNAVMHIRQPTCLSAVTIRWRLALTSSRDVASMTLVATSTHPTISKLVSMCRLVGYVQYDVCDISFTFIMYFINLISRIQKFSIYLQTKHIIDQCLCWLSPVWATVAVHSQMMYKASRVTWPLLHQTKS